MKQLLLALFCTIALVTPARAAGPSVIPGPFSAEVVRVYDGDTFTVRVYPWLGMTIETGIRVIGIDTPELYGAPCQTATQIAAAARVFTVRTLSTAKSILVSDITEDKYSGRVDANVTVDGKSLAELLIAQGFAKPYAGKGAKPNWCQ